MKAKETAVINDINGQMKSRSNLRSVHKIVLILKSSTLHTVHKIVSLIL